MGGAFRIYESAERSSDMSFDRDPDRIEFSTTAVSTSTCVDENKAIVEFETTDINPLGDRLLVFWSDRIVHSVQPSQVSQAFHDSFFSSPYSASTFLYS